MGLNKQQISDLSLFLQQQPDQQEIREHSGQEVIKALKSDILVLQKQGYTLLQIADILKAGGLTISAPTLKSYLQRARKPLQRKPNASVPKAAQPSEQSGIRA